MTPPTELARLAERLGVATGYVDQGGTWRVVDEEVVREVLSALGFAAPDEGSARAALDALVESDWQRIVPPVVVARRGRSARIPIHLPHGSQFSLSLVLEGGTTGPAPRQVEHNRAPFALGDRLIGEAMIESASDLPLGWHRLTVTTEAGEAECDLVVTPDRLAEPSRRGRGWGFAAQLYSVRSAGSWGIGDFADLADIVSWSAALGADHVVINPVHAAEPTIPRSDSPYLPTSRRFDDPLYLRVEWIPEFAMLKPAAAARVAELQRESATTGELLDRDVAWRAKVAALRIVYEVPLATERAASLDQFVLEGGAWLRDYATWCAISVARGQGPWPGGLRDCRSEDVAAVAESLADEVRFHMWLQWLLAEQAAQVQAMARAAGMSIGVIRDLAVGVHPGGADVWCLPGLLLPDVSVGAPPDMYNQLGQDWSQPPWHPLRLEAASYRPFRDLVRATLAHAGGLRIDHILGLFRLWWIPKGRPAGDGTFVRYDADALLGILALEAERAGAVVVGEDLGTVEPGVAGALADLGVLGTDVLWFERQGPGRIKAPEDWRPGALASVTVHDLPPTLGYLAAGHVRLRESLGLLRTDPAAEYSATEVELADWRELLRNRGLLADDDPVDVMVGLHALLGASAARLIAISLADAAGEVRAQNQPGTYREYPNWRIPLGDVTGRPVTIAELARAELPLRLIRAVNGTTAEN